MSMQTILICDDDEDILYMLQLVLENSGYTIIAEKNSLNVYKLIEKHLPDLILMDLWMPVLSGDMIVRSLRGNPATRKLPIIISSASRDGERIAKDAGASDYLSKPFNVEELLARVEKCIN